MEERISGNGSSPKALVKLNAEAAIFTPCEQQRDAPKTSTSFTFNFPKSEQLPSGLWTYEFKEHDQEFAREYFKASTPPPDRAPVSQAEIDNYFKSGPVARTSQAEERVNTYETPILTLTPANSRDLNFKVERPISSGLQADITPAAYTKAENSFDRVAITALQQPFSTTTFSHLKSWVPAPEEPKRNHHRDPRRKANRQVLLPIFEAPELSTMDESVPPIVNTPTAQSMFVLFGEGTELPFFHCWAQTGGFHPHEVIPAIPSFYNEDVVQGRALYVHNVPYGCLNETFRDLFPDYQVIRDPTLTDLDSQVTFRWVIFRTAAQAEHALANMQSFPFLFKETTGETNMYVLSMCKASRISYELGGAWPLERFLRGDIPVAPATYNYPQFTGEGPVAPPSLSAIHAYNQRFGFPPSSFQAQIDSAPHTHGLLNNQNHGFQGGQQATESPVEVEKKPEAPFTTEEIARGAEIAEEEKSVTDVDAATEQLAKVDLALEKPKQEVTSWAKMASTSAGESKTIDLKPIFRNRVASAGASDATGLLSGDTTNGESLAQQARLIFLLDLPSNMTLEKISDGIKEGPLVSIRMGTNEDDGKRYAGIIFQFARDAEAFFQVLLKERAEKRPDRFHFIVDVARGEDAIPMDDTIKAMGSPINATRRLTIVKSKFFFFMRDAQLREFCKREVGEENIQLIWLYNGGNATVAFAKVDDAIKVKKALDHQAATADPQSHWFGLNVSYSKDPCIQDLNLVTDLQDR